MNNSIVLNGPLDQYAAESLKEQAATLLELSGNAVFDFSDVDRMHTASLQVLLALRKDLARNGRTVVLERVDTQVRELFRLSGAESYFEFSDGAR